MLYDIRTANECAGVLSKETEHGKGNKTFNELN